MVKLGAPSSSKLKAIEDVDDEVRQIAPRESQTPDLFDGEDESDEGDDDER